MDNAQDTSKTARWDSFRAANSTRDLHRLGALMGNQFLDAPDETAEADALSLIEAAVCTEPLPAALSALHVLRQLRHAHAVDLARRIAATWPRDWQLRYTLSNTLFLADPARWGLDALQQRIIGRSMELYASRKSRNYGFTTQGASIVGKHLSDVARIKAFLDGQATYPTSYIAELARQSRLRLASDYSIATLDRLVRVGQWVAPPITVENVPDRTLIVVDTNAIADPFLFRWFGHPKLEFIAPPGVLLEFARWDAIERVPWQFDAVGLRRVGGTILPEINQMSSSKKHEPPSETDKHVAMLAVLSKAKIIVSSDRDLWDSGMTHAVEKNTGFRTQVFLPRTFGNWAKRMHQGDAV